MTEDNLIFLYKGMQFSSMVDVRGCEYTDCTSNSEKLFVIDEDVWQFCHPHSSVILNAFCKVEVGE